MYSAWQRLLRAYTGVRNVERVRNADQFIATAETDVSTVPFWAGFLAACPERIPAMGRAAQDHVRKAFSYPAFISRFEALISDRSGLKMTGGKPDP